MFQDGGVTQRLRIAIVLGSVRRGRRGELIAEWFAEQARSRATFEVDLIDLADADISAALVHESSDRLESVKQRIEEADVYAIVSPEYNHGYTAALKALIDVTYSQWRAKPVAFVSYGGISGGLRAVEQLRQVFAEMHTVTVRDSVAFANVFQAFTDDGELKDPEGAERAAQKMLWQLEWWGEALRNARSENPYAA
jgi:NAD(P)H-dependent FMN reductase